MKEGVNTSTVVIKKTLRKKKKINKKNKNKNKNNTYPTANPK